MIQKLFQQGVKFLAMLCITTMLAPSVSYAEIYAPGATLDPSCLPTDTNCGVSVPLTEDTEDAVVLSVASSTPTDTTDKLYNLGGILYWAGSAVGSTSAVASTTAVGIVSTTTQSFAGWKTFTGTSTLATTTATKLSANILTVIGTSTLATTTVSGILATSQGITIASSTPATTTLALYNLGDTLYWNGLALEGAAYASTTVNGIVSTTTQSFAGWKTFTGTSTLATTTATTLTAGLFAVTGTSTLATTTATALSANTLTVFGTSTLATTTATALSANTLTVFGTSTLATTTATMLSANILTVTGTSTLATTTVSGLTVSQNGIRIASSTPSATSSALYALGTTLYWNGAELGGNATGTPGLIQFTDGAGHLLATSSLSFATSTGTFMVTSTSTFATTSASFFTTTGKVGVGTSTSLAWLTVNGADSTSDLFRIATSTNQNLFVVTNDGKVGIGTSAPTEALEVHGNVYITGNLTALGTTTSVDVSNLAVADKNIYLASSTNPTDLLADGGGIILKASTTKSILWDLASNLWTFSHGIKVNSTSTSVFVGGISAATSTLATTTISLLDVTGTSTLAHAIVSNKLAIGTTTPGSILHVVGAGSQMRIQGTSGADYADIVFNNAGDTTASAYSTSTWQLSRRNNGDFQFANYPGSVYTSRLTITKEGLFSVGTTTVSNFTATATSTLATTSASLLTTTGKVGVGTSTPLAWLTVNGDDSTSDLFKVSTSTNNSILTINNKGFLGLGTTTPGSMLTVVGDSWFTATSTFMGNVGIGAANTSGAKLAISNTGLTPSLLVGGAVAFTGGTIYAPTTVYGDDVNVGNTSVVRVDTATSSFLGIRGIADITGTSTAHTDGQLLTLINASSTSAFYLYNQSASSTAANRIITGTGGDMQIAGDASVLLSYDAASARWRVIGGAGGSGAGSMTIVSATTNQTLSAWGRTVMMDVTSANRTVTLPTAVLNDGTSIEVIKTDNSANVVTVSAFGAQTINGSTNPIYLYGQGDSIVLRSDGANVQIVSDNRSSVGQSKSYMRAGRPTAQTTGLSAGNPVVFTTVNSSYGSDIALNTTTGIFTLKAGKTYHLRGTPSWISGSNVNASFQWYDITNSTGIGNVIQFVSSAADVSTTEADAIITPSTDITVRLNINNTSGMTQIGDGSGRAPFAFIDVVSTPQNTISTVDTLYAVKTGTQNLSAAGDLTFVKQTGNMTFDGTYVTLLAGKTYEISAGLNGSDSVTTGFINASFTNSSNTVIGNSSFSSEGVQYSGATNSSFMPNSTIIYTPTADTQVKVRVTSVNAGTHSVTAGSYLVVKQIGTTGTVGLPFNYISEALAAGLLDNTNFNQDWNWSTLTTTNGLDLAANALTTGSLLTLTSSNATLNSTNGLLYVGNTGASTNGTVARIQSNSTAGSGLTVLANGNVGIGTTTPTNKLQVDGGDIRMDAERRFYMGTSTTNFGQMWYEAGGLTNLVIRNGTTGGVYLNDPGATTWSVSSDARLKKNVNTLDASTLEKVLAMNPVTYNWISGSEEKQVGFIAQEINALGLTNLVALPENPDDLNGCVPGSETANDCYGVNYDRFAPYLVKAIQEQNVLVFGTSTDALSFAASTFPEGLTPALASLTDAAAATSTVSESGEVTKTFVGKFLDRLIAWFADATNGITNFFAKNVYTEQICVKKDDGSNYCVTGDELEAAIGGGTTVSGTTNTVTTDTNSNDGTNTDGSGAATSTDSNGDTTSSATTTPAALNLNGDDPMTVLLNSTWTDPGAEFSYNGTTATVDSADSVDTAVLGVTTLTYTYEYTDAEGVAQTITATRAVEVVETATTTQSGGGSETISTGGEGSVSDAGTVGDTVTDADASTDAPADNTDSSQTQTTETPQEPEAVIVDTPDTPDTTL